MTSERDPTDLLLQSKLLRPRMPGKVVQRPRLLDKLEGGLRRPLVLVSAPAGYGKTSLVNLWLETLDEPYAGSPSMSAMPGRRVSWPTWRRPCAEERVKMPNFIAVNWFSEGDLVDVVDTLNGVYQPEG
jgi:hypothetical protein